MDFCAYFKEIAKDPSAKAPQITVSQFLKARQHILVCHECSSLVDDIVDANPPQDKSGIKIGLN